MPPPAAGSLAPSPESRLRRLTGLVVDPDEVSPAVEAHGVEVEDSTDTAERKPLAVAVTIGIATLVHQ